MTEQELFVTTIARHFDEAKVHGDTIDVGFGGLTMACRVGRSRPAMGVHSVELFIRLSADALSASPELYMTAYGETAEHAIVTSACAWACEYGPVFRAALTGATVDGVDFLRIIVGDRDAEIRGYIGRCDAIFALSPEGSEGPDEARERISKAKYFTPHLLRDVPLAVDRVQLLTVFVGETPQARVIEVKLDGVQHRGAEPTFADAPEPSRPQMSLLRELVLLVPAKAMPS